MMRIVKRQPKPAGATQAGYSLVEILVSIFVMSVGLVGLAMIQANSFRLNHNSHLRNVAITQASAMADRMRSNPAGVNQGAYDSLTGIPQVGPGCGGSCTATQAAAQDFFEWSQDSVALLPAGQGRVVRNGAMHIITVMWDDDKTGATGTNCSGNPNVDLMCYSLSIEY